MEQEKIKAGVKLILEGLGENTNREGLLRTPERVARLYSRLFVGYGEKPKITKFTNEKKVDDLQARKCDFVSFCMHHVVPFAGVVYVGYLPKEWLIGMDKIDLVVDYFAGKLQLQENMVHEIADFLEEILAPKAVMVQAYAIHYCALCKGNSGSFASSAIRGDMRVDPNLKMECFEMFKRLDRLSLGGC